MSHPYHLQCGGILLTTYDVVRNNWQALRGDFHGRDGFGDTSDDITTWDYMVLDEVCFGGCYFLVLSIGMICFFIKELYTIPE